MKLTINNSYKLVIQIGDRFLTFSARIINEDDDSVTFIDKEGKELSYKKADIKSSEVISNGN